ncbi:MAG: methyltransferase domain-containing protein [Acidobacteriota bacterium]|nr:methyltransferase domain-containing protein [Acidobacteriota bacterium]
MDYIHKLKNLLPRDLHPHLGAARRRLRTLPARTRRQKQRLLDDPAMETKERELLKQVETRISAGDGMYTGDGAHYYKVGLSAIRSIEEAIDAAQLESLTRILDLPCGHGRVLRFLVRRFPQAEITASDLDRKGVDFCSRLFGTQAVYSELNLDEFSVGRQFDLIWCGSLVTHLNETGIRALLAFFARHLQPDGLLIFTAHGERVIQLLQDQEFEYGIAPESVAPIIEAYHKGGFGFADYPGASAYGISLTSPEWIRRAAAEIGLGEVYFSAHGWDNHQDVYGFTLQNRRLWENIRGLSVIRRSERGESGARSRTSCEFAGLELSIQG